ncbi:MAG: hypothetical protein ACI9BK_001296 [Acidimicrobiales bacterium]
MPFRCDHTLRDWQRRIQDWFNTGSNPVDFVFHGGSGSASPEITRVIPATPSVLGRRTPSTDDWCGYEYRLMQTFESISTWRQPAPLPASAQPSPLLAEVAVRLVARGKGLLRVAVGGYSASAKTSFGHELATAVRGLGPPTMRACLDGFNKPWREATKKA